MTDTPSVRLLVWRAGGVRCAAPVERLREVLPELAVAALPGTPAAIRGVANVRGTLVTVVDGRRLLGLPDGVPSLATVVVRFGARFIGLSVDDVEDLVVVTDAAIEPAPGAVEEWVVRLEDGAARLLDLDQLLEPLFA